MSTMDLGLACLADATHDDGMAMGLAVTTAAAAIGMVNVWAIRWQMGGEDAPYRATFRPSEKDVSGLAHAVEIQGGRAWVSEVDLEHLGTPGIGWWLDFDVEALEGLRRHLAERYGQIRRQCRNERKLRKLATALPEPAKRRALGMIYESKADLATTERAMKKTAEAIEKLQSHEPSETTLEDTVED